MPTEDTNSTNSSTDETSGQESQDQQQSTTPETGGNGDQQQASTSTEPLKLPEDHPLVKTLATQKAAIASHKSEIAELRAKSKKVTELETELTARPSQEAVDTLQSRYDRLESFLQAVGGPLSKALDSRSFTTKLFESDENVQDLVKQWHRDNPSATSTALGSSAAEPGKGKIDPNVLLRAAAGR